MKVENSIPQLFVPKSITITFETQNEMDVLGSLFNVGIVATELRCLGIDPAAIYNKIRDAGGDIYAHTNKLNQALRKGYTSY